VDIRPGARHQFTDQFLSVCPNNKIPAIRDNEDDVDLFESCHILLHYADREKKFIPKDTQGRANCLNWLFWQAACLGPFTGQVGALWKYGGHPSESSQVQRFVSEVNRLLGVLEKQLSDGRKYIVGDEYTIADMASWPWVRTPAAFYNAEHMIDVSKYSNVEQWLNRCMERKASKTALEGACNWITGECSDGWLCVAHSW
jgi:GST-like protein